MTEQTIEILCEKFGVTVNELVNELFRYHTAMDKISIIVWSIVLIVSILSIWIFKIKIKDWWNNNSWKIIFIAFPIAFIFIGLIILPLLICDLIQWYVSPLGAALSLIM